MSVAFFDCATPGNSFMINALHHLYVSSTVGANRGLIKNTSQTFLTFVYLYFMQLFSVDPTIFSKKAITGNSATILYNTL